ncbi:minor capsid protein [Loigolactobacillus backii]|uniref:minor capsid protein n=1 Tax=Loigolactobacillus backii TaxID=375175 RepID=UPI001EE7174A|nr:minor capsid protein [Loigolactobacillus backii]
MDRLCDKLNETPDLPTPIRLGYMQPDDALALYPLPGSTTIDEDWSGNETRHINYELAIRTKDAELGNASMWALSNALDLLNDLESNDNSFQFEQIQQTGLPSLSEQDDQGYTVYMLDFFVEIIVNNRR